MSRLTKKNINGYDLVQNGEIYYVWWNDMTKKCVYKLANFEDLEEELGCPLEVVFKVLKENISFQRKDIITNEIHILEGFDSYIVYNKVRKIYELHTTFKAERNNWIANLDLKDYQKTWWLKGEKDE